MKRRAVLCILSGLIFLALITTLIARGQSRTDKFYSDALQAHTVSADVLVDGDLITVRAGVTSMDGVPVTGALSLEAKRLAYARTLAERNPLFAFPGTSPSDLAYAVDVLEATANQLADLHGDDARAELIRTSLYPIEFLRTAVAAETARLEFIAHTDSQHEREYELAVRKEIAAYVSNLHTFRNAVSEIVPDTIPAYIAAGKIVSKATILSALDTVEKEVRTSIHTFDTRMLCLRGAVPHCNPQDLSVPSLEIPESVRIDAQSLARAREIQAFYANITDDAQLRNAPLIILSESACAGDAPGPAVFFISESKEAPGVPIHRRSVFMGDIRFIRIDEYGDLPFYQDLRSRGIEFVLSPPLLHYECMDQRLDVAAILSTWTTLSVSSSSVLYQAEAVRTAHTRALSGDPAGIALALAIKYNSTQFDKSLRDIAWSEQKNLTLRKEGFRPDLDIPNLFFARSGFVSLFAIHNSSFFARDLTLFPPSHIPASKQPYLYDSQIPPGTKKLKLRHDVREYILLHFAGHVL